MTIISRAFGAALALSISLTTAVAMAGEASAVPVKKYASCKELNKVYPSGVGLPGARDKVARGGRPVTNFTRNAAVYKLNAARRDADKDGIACEKHVDLPGKPAPKPTPKPVPKPAPKPVPSKPVPTPKPRTDLLQFADPTGSVLCAMSANPARKGTWKVTCAQLRLMSNSRYTKLCTKQRFEGLTTRAEGSGWNCSTKPSATPWSGQPGTHWAGKTTKVVTGRYGYAKGKRLVTLAPKQRLALGTITCAQSNASTTCSNSTTKQGFTVTPAGAITWRGVQKVATFGDVKA